MSPHRKQYKTSVYDCKQQQQHQAQPSASQKGQPSTAQINVESHAQTVSGQAPQPQQQQSPQPQIQLPVPQPTPGMKLPIQATTIRFPPVLQRSVSSVSQVDTQSHQQMPVPSPNRQQQYPLPSGQVPIQAPAVVNRQLQQQQSPPLPPPLPGQQQQQHHDVHVDPATQPDTGSLAPPQLAQQHQPQPVSHVVHDAATQTSPQHEDGPTGKNRKTGSPRQKNVAGKKKKG